MWLGNAVTSSTLHADPPSNETIDVFYIKNVLRSQSMLWHFVRTLYLHLSVLGFMLVPWVHRVTCFYMAQCCVWDCKERVTMVTDTGRWFWVCFVLLSHLGGLTSETHRATGPYNKNYAALHCYMTALREASTYWLYIHWPTYVHAYLCIVQLLTIGRN